MVNSAVYDGEFDRDNVTKRGRPSIDRAEKKHRRNVTVSDEAWQALQDRIIKTLGIRSVSELNEKIGLEKLKVLDVENPSIKFADVPIYPRLKSLLEPPSAVFFSLLRFFLRVARELQLDTKERLIFDVVNKSAAIIFYIVYIHPDIYISNPSALMRWLGWRFLWIQYYKNLSSNQAKVSQKKRSEQPSDRQVEAFLWKIANTLESLEKTGRTTAYSLLRMRVIDGLNVPQIKRILRAQGQPMTGVEVRKIIKEGFAQLRKTWEIVPDCPQNDKQASKNVIPSDAKIYCKSLLSNFLKEENVFTTIDCLLLQASKETRLDFWLNEIDNFLDVEFDKSTLIDERKLEKIAKTINDNIDSYLANKKERIDKMLACCATEQDIENLLVKMANEELGSEELKSLEIKEKIQIEIEHLIGEKREYTLEPHCHAILNCG